MTDPQTGEEYVASAEALVDHLRSQRVSVYPAYEQRPGEKLVRLAFIWRQALLYRIVDLASAALDLFREQRLVPGCTLTRSLYETVAQLNYLHKKVIGFIANPDIPEIADFVIRGSWGSKDQSTEQDAIQVLTAIKHLNKTFPGSEDEYFHLCEYAHPNFKGGLGTYARMEIPSLEVAFGVNPQNLPMVSFGLGGLEIILTIASELFSQLLKTEADFGSAVYVNAVGKYIE